MKLRIAQGITCNLAVALAVQEDVGRFLVAVNDVSRVEVVGGAEQLVHDEALVHLLQDVAFPAMRNGISFLILTDATLFTHHSILATLALRSTVIG